MAPSGASIRTFSSAAQTSAGSQQQGLAPIDEEDDQSDLDCELDSDVEDVSKLNPAQLADDSSEYHEIATKGKPWLLPEYAHLFRQKEDAPHRFL